MKENERHLTAVENARKLIKQMTVEEKANQLRAQLLYLNHYNERDFSVGHFRNIAHFMHENGPQKPSECAKAINEDTRKSMEASRLHIPVLQNGESLHGAQWGNATCFPQAIGLAATFDPELVHTVAEVIAKELRAVGVRQAFSPVINITRDCRWGRTEESYGEDVCLTSKIAVAYVKGLEENGIVATPKHFVDNYADGGRDSNESHSSWRALREVYLEPFRACVQEGGARSVMSAYNILDGVPCSCNKKLLTDILRDEWGFSGFVVSDYSAVYGIFSQHNVAASHADAQAMALNAGLDVELATGYGDLPRLLGEGKITQEALDKAVERVLAVKFELGLFEEPFVDPEAADRIVRCKEHRELALKAAEKSMVLLKNKNHALPLCKSRLKTIGLFGPGADTVNVGGYSGPYGGWRAQDAMTPYEAIHAYAGDHAKVILCKDGQQVTEIAKKCDVALYFSATNEGEGADRCDLRLPCKKAKPKGVEHAMVIDRRESPEIEMNQEEIISDLIASGTKVIVILINGSPVDMECWLDSVDAVLEAWYPGEQGSAALTKVLFGESCPGGKLPISFPKSIGQLPLCYSFKPSGRSYRYNENDGKPRFAFGFGLSYTTFSFSDFQCEQNGSDVKVSVCVTNSGNRSGDEVVQLYIQGKNSGVARPLKELKAFRRITLAPGCSQTMELRLSAADFCFWNRDLVFTLGPADYEIMLGNASDNILFQKHIPIRP